MNIRVLPLFAGFAGIIVTASTARAQSAVSLQIPVEVTTQSLKDQLERAIPASIDRTGAWEFHGSRGIRYGAWRGPIQVSTTGNAVRVQTRIQYALAACQRIKKPRPLKGYICPQIAQCGFGESRAELDVVLDISGAWSPSWAFVPSVKPSISVVRACRLTIANINVSDRATGLLRRKIEAEARKIQEKLQFKARVEEAWKRVTPKQIAGNLWLTWQLDSVSVQPLQLTPDRVRSAVTLAATPLLLQGQDAPAPAPLPSSLTIGAAPAASPSWQLDAELSWNDISRILAFAPYTHGGVMNVTLSGLSGSANGRVRADFQVEGTPVSVSAKLHHDSANDEASLTELKLESNPPPFVKLAGDVFLEEIRTKLRWKLGPVMEPKLTGVSEELRKAGLLSGQVGAGARVEVLQVSASGLSVRVVVPGSLQIAPSW